jgi:predicted DCC family thiol-disulfide oxidoreductase YuxK
MSSSEAQYVLFWDGDCAFCARCVSWALTKGGRALRAVPYQQATDPPMDAALQQACRRAVHLYRPSGQMERAGRACLTVLYLMGYGRLSNLLRRRPFVWLVECGYWLVARNRSFFSRFLFRT